MSKEFKDQSYSLRCPKNIYTYLFIRYPRELPRLYRNIKWVDLYTVAEDHIIFELYYNVYDSEKVLIERRWLLGNPEAKNVFDAIVNAAKPWGQPSKLALGMLSKVLEDNDVGSGKG